MAYQVTIESANGEQHGPMPIPPGFLASVAEPLPLEVAAEFARRVAEDQRQLMGANAHRLGFRAPITITVEDV